MAPVSLHAYVDGDGPRLVLVHGFAQSAQCWGPMADDLATDHEVLRFDAPGHGRSARAEPGLSEGARLMAERGGPATYLGYSMGGRYLLHCALECPDVVRGLVLVSTTAGIDDPAARATRRRLDEAMAERLEAQGLDAFLDAWLAQPLFSGLVETTQFRPARAENTVAGLAASLRRAGTGTQQALWDRLADLAMPVLVMAGADDARFRTEAQRMVAVIGTNATMAVIAGAGHAAHLEQPREFVHTLRPWLAAHGL